MHDKILSSALEIFSEKGFDAATMKDISRRAGCNPVTLFRHFNDKQTLFDTCVENYKSISFDSEKLDSKLSYINLHGDFRIMADYFFQVMYENIHILRIFINDLNQSELVRKNVWFVPEELKEFVINYLSSMYLDKLSGQESTMLAEMFICYITRTCLRLNVQEGIESYSKTIAKNARTVMEPSVDMIVAMVLSLTEK